MLRQLLTRSFGVRILPNLAYWLSAFTIEAFHRIVFMLADHKIKALKRACVKMVQILDHISYALFWLSKYHVRRYVKFILAFLAQ